MKCALDTSKTLALISHIHSCAEEYLCTELKKKGLPELSTSHGFILYNLSVFEKLTMGEIAAKINRDKSTATVLVKKLINLNLVETKSCTKDSRVKYVSLSEKGKQFTDATAEISANLLKKCYKGFSSKDAENLTSYLLCVANNFDSE